MFKLKLFAASLLLTTAAMLAFIYAGSSLRRARTPRLNFVADNLFVTAQLQPEGIPYLKTRGIETVVDIRPDGETADQPPSSEIKAASESDGLQFHYIPVPHECIPDDAVNSLSEVLSHRTTPAVLYCRTGRRAVRTFALVEASRRDGPSADAINKLVHDAGFTAEDLKDEINRRIAARSNLRPEKP